MSFQPASLIWKAVSLWSAKLHAACDNRKFSHKLTLKTLSVLYFCKGVPESILEFEWGDLDIIHRNFMLYLLVKIEKSQ